MSMNQSQSRPNDNSLPSPSNGQVEIMEGPAKKLSLSKSLQVDTKRSSLFQQSAELLAQSSFSPQSSDMSADNNGALDQHQRRPLRINSNTITGSSSTRSRPLTSPSMAQLRARKILEAQKNRTTTRRNSNSNSKHSHGLPLSPRSDAGSSCWDDDDDDDEEDASDVSSFANVNVDPETVKHVSQFIDSLQIKSQNVQTNGIGGSGGTTTTQSSSSRLTISANTGTININIAEMTTPRSKARYQSSLANARNAMAASPIVVSKKGSTPRVVRNGNDMMASSPITRRSYTPRTSVPTPTTRRDTAPTTPQTKRSDNDERERGGSSPDCKKDVHYYAILAQIQKVMSSGGSVSLGRILADANKRGMSLDVVTEIYKRERFKASQKLPSASNVSEMTADAKVVKNDDIVNEDKSVKPSGDDVPSSPRVDGIQSGSGTSPEHSEVVSRDESIKPSGDDVPTSPRVDSIQSSSGTTPKSREVASSAKSTKPRGDDVPPSPRVDSIQSGSGATPECREFAKNDERVLEHPKVVSSDESVKPSRDNVPSPPRVDSIQSVSVATPERRDVVKNDETVVEHPNVGSRDESIKLPGVDVPSSPRLDGIQSGSVATPKSREVAKNDETVAEDPKVGSRDESIKPSEDVPPSPRVDGIQSGSGTTPKSREVVKSDDLVLEHIKVVGRDKSIFPSAYDAPSTPRIDSIQSGSVATPERRGFAKNDEMVLDDMDMNEIELLYPPPKMVSRDFDTSMPRGKDLKIVKTDETVPEDVSIDAADGAISSPVEARDGEIKTSISGEIADDMKELSRLCDQATALFNESSFNSGSQHSVPSDDETMFVQSPEGKAPDMSGEKEERAVDDHQEMKINEKSEIFGQRNGREGGDGTSQPMMKEEEQNPANTAALDATLAKYRMKLANRELALPMKKEVDAADVTEEREVNATAAVKASVGCDEKKEPEPLKTSVSDAIMDGHGMKLRNEDLAPSANDVAVAEATMRGDEKPVTINGYHGQTWDETGNKEVASSADDVAAAAVAAMWGDEKPAIVNGFYHTAVPSVQIQSPPIDRGNGNLDSIASDVGMSECSPTNSAFTRLTGLTEALSICRGKGLPASQSVFMGLLANESNESDVFDNVLSDDEEVDSNINPGLHGSHSIPPVNEDLPMNDRMQQHTGMGNLQKDWDLDFGIEGLSDTQLRQLEQLVQKSEELVEADISESSARPVTGSINATIPGHTDNDSVVDAFFSRFSIQEDGDQSAPNHSNGNPQSKSVRKVGFDTDCSERSTKSELANLSKKEQNVTQPQIDGPVGRAVIKEGVKISAHFEEAPPDDVEIEYPEEKEATGENRKTKPKHQSGEGNKDLPKNLALWKSPWQRHHNAGSTSFDVTKPNSAAGVDAAGTFSRQGGGGQHSQCFLPMNMRKTGHHGYKNVDFYSLYEATAVEVEDEDIDRAPWEYRDVGQRFLHEKSVETRNWFGSFELKRCNDRIVNPVSRPKSLELALTKIAAPGEWSEDWYTTWKSRKDNPNNLVTFARDETVKTNANQKTGFNSTDIYRVSSSSSKKFIVEIGSFCSVRARSGERISRVHHEFTSSLRQSRYRKKYLKGSLFRIE